MVTSPEEKEAIMALVAIIMSDDRTEMNPKRAKTLLDYMARLETERRKLKDTELSAARDRLVQKARR